MKINLEKYLKTKRKELDVEEPDDALLWEGIRKEIITEKKASGFNLWKVAAIFLAVFTLSYIIYNEISREKEREFTLSQINESLGAREKAYQQTVILKMQDANIQELSGTSENDIIPVLINELNVLDTIYQDAISDLKQHGYMEQIVEIIFDTYEKRIRILEKIIMETRKIEKYEEDIQEVSL
jgi:hypothetical protein